MTYTQSVQWLDATIEGDVSKTEILKAMYVAIANERQTVCGWRLLEN